MKRDEIVNKQLNFLGWTVIRFWGKDIIKDTEQCVKIIQETIFGIEISGFDNLTDDLESDNSLPWEE